MWKEFITLWNNKINLDSAGYNKINPKNFIAKCYKCQNQLFQFLMPE
jgi:hypothetical protein